MWDPPGPGLEPVSPALAAGFLTTVPPGKPDPFLFVYDKALTLRIKTQDSEILRIKSFSFPSIISPGNFKFQQFWGFGMIKICSSYKELIFVYIFFLIKFVILR